MTPRRSDRSQTKTGHDSGNRAPQMSRIAPRIPTGETNKRDRDHDWSDPFDAHSADQKQIDATFRLDNRCRQNDRHHSRRRSDKPAFGARKARRDPIKEKQRRPADSAAEINSRKPLHSGTSLKETPEKCKPEKVENKMRRLILDEHIAQNSPRTCRKTGKRPRQTKRIDTRPDPLLMAAQQTGSSDQTQHNENSHIDSQNPCDCRSAGKQTARPSGHTASPVKPLHPINNKDRSQLRSSSSREASGNRQAFHPDERNEPLRH